MWVTKHSHRISQQPEIFAHGTVCSLLTIGCQTETNVTLTAFAKDPQTVKRFHYKFNNFKLPSFFLDFKHRNCAYLRYRCVYHQTPNDIMKWSAVFIWSFDSGVVTYHYRYLICFWFSGESYPTIPDLLPIQRRVVPYRYLICFRFGDESYRTIPDLLPIRRWVVPNHTLSASDSTMCRTVPIPDLLPIRRCIVMYLPYRYLFCFRIAVESYHTIHDMLPIRRCVVPYHTWSASDSAVRSASVACWQTGWSTSSSLSNRSSSSTTRPHRSWIRCFGYGSRSGRIQNFLGQEDNGSDQRPFGEKKQILIDNLLKTCNVWYPV